MLISEKQLRDWLGYRRRAEIEKALEAAGIRFLRGKGGSICTCEKWLTEAKKVRQEVEFK